MTGLQKGHAVLKCSTGVSGCPRKPSQQAVVSDLYRWWETLVSTGALRLAWGKKKAM
jgi:hypothetical protein